RGDLQGVARERCEGRAGRDGRHPAAAGYPEGERVRRRRSVRSRHADGHDHRLRPEVARREMTAVEHGSGQRVDALLARAALTQPLRAAVVCGRLSWTYAEVYERACRLAGALAALGVRKGDRVALWTANRPEFVEV